MKHLALLLLLVGCASPRPAPTLPEPGIATEADCVAAFGTRATDYVRRSEPDGGYWLTAYLSVAGELHVVPMHFDARGVLTGYGQASSVR